MLKRGFWTTAFILTGTTIGAGILGLPYVFSQSGFFIGLFWLIVLGVVMIFINLCLGEVALRTKGIHQIPGYAEKYLGKNGKKFMLFAILFGVYSALIAYLIGEGQSFSQLFFGNTDYSIYFAFAFWIVMTALLQEGFRELRRVELWGVIAIAIIIFSMFFWFYDGINFENLQVYDVSNFFLPFGVLLFALLGFTTIPEMRIEIMENERKFKNAIILGTLISIILYFIFTLTVVGVLGKEIQEVSTLSFGGIFIVLGIFTMLTSYFVLSFSLRDIFFYDMNSKSTFFLVSILPLLMYLFVVFFNIFDFVQVLGIGGVVSGGLTGILILLMNLKAKKEGKRKPEFSVPMNWFIIILLGLIFVVGTLFEIF